MDSKIYDSIIDLLTKVENGDMDNVTVELPKELDIGDIGLSLQQYGYYLELLHGSNKGVFAYFKKDDIAVKVKISYFDHITTITAYKNKV